ncbi:MAG TPA: response regulator [Polyangiaceae bacterium]|nr:response regulator [Polyangiaceae bacterium]
MADPYRYFRVEAAEILEQLQKSLLELERGAPPVEIVGKLLRLAHTLKGAARVVKQTRIADLSHLVEDLWVPVRDSGQAVEGRIVAASLQHVDSMRAQLQALSEPSAGPVAAPLQSAAGADEPFWAAKASSEELDVLMDGIGELNVRLGGVRETRAGLEHARNLAELLRDQLAMRRRLQSSDADLVRLRSLADELEAVLAACERQVASNVEQASRELGQVRDAAERLRLVPAANLWGALERTARDAAVGLGKRVRFEATGGDVRLEADLLAQVQRALLQAVRNAVAHGIEIPSERESSRKNPEGLVEVGVQRRDEQVVFSCRDDGRGLDQVAVRRSAEQRGIKPSALAGLDSDGLARLLLRGGISTSSSVSAVSGRGIGLDLIREVAENLGGTVAMRSNAPSGTVIELAVPVSLSALSALLVEVTGRIVALPLGAVRGTARRLEDEVTHTAEGDTVVLDGKIIPYVALDRLLTPDTPEPMRQANRSAVMVAAEGAMVAVGVERLLGIESIVVRGVPDLALLSPIVSGASFDADGNPRIVLSPEGLIHVARHTAAAPRAHAKSRAPILVIDDSLTTRMLEQSILESAGYEVELAVSGEEGMDKARLRKYALFLVDVEMPGMDGFTFIERTRADPELRQIPAILVTSRASAEDLERGRAVGALAHIEKREFNQTDLLERIRKLVG